MICGSCLHDNTLAAALKRQGHDIALIPTYTPIRTDEVDVSIDRVFYGAISVYLEQKVPLLRAMPRFAGRIFDHPRLLGLVSRIGASIDARKLGGLTLSLLQGENGRQARELDELVAWLKDDYRPDIVHVTNPLLIGVVRKIKSELSVPVLCSVQGEDIFLEQLVEPYRSRVRETLRERAREVDGFVATSRYYADYMTAYLDMPADRMHHVRLGIRLDGHGGDRRGREPGAPFTVGYLARICPEKGLHVLIDAFRSLVERDRGAHEVRLRIAGWLGKRDRRYFDGCMERARSQGLDKRIEHVGEVDREGKIDFLRSLDVLSVPTVYREPKGLYVLEALANGVPVVQPDHGAFPELIGETGGGVLVTPDSPEAIAAGLYELMTDEARRAALGRRGREVVHALFGDASMAQATLDLYRRYTRETR